MLGGDGGGRDGGEVIGGLEGDIDLKGGLDDPRPPRIHPRLPGDAPSDARRSLAEGESRRGASVAAADVSGESDHRREAAEPGQESEHAGPVRQLFCRGRLSRVRHGRHIGRYLERGSRRNFALVSHILFSALRHHTSKIVRQTIETVALSSRIELARGFRSCFERVCRTSTCIENWAKALEDVEYRFRSALFRCIREAKPTVK